MGLLFRRLLAAAVLLTAFALPIMGHVPYALAQQAAPAATAMDAKAIRAKLDNFRADLDWREKSLLTGTKSDEQLSRLREETEAIGHHLRTILSDLDPRIAALKQRLAQLGQKPAEGAPEESPDVASERTEREAAVAELGELQKIANSLLVQADQLSATLAEQRRTLFTQSILKRSHSILSPGLWQEVIETLPEDLEETHSLIVDWANVIQRNWTYRTIPVLGLTGAFVLLLLGLRRRFRRTWINRDPDLLHPSIRLRLVASLWVLLIGVVPVFIAVRTILAVLEGLDLLSLRIAPTVFALGDGIVLVAMAGSLVDALFSPRFGAWRVLSVGDVTAMRIRWFYATLFGWLAAKMVVDKFNEAIAASVPLTLLCHAVFSLVPALVVIRILRIRTVGQNQEAEAAPTYAASEESHLTGILRILGWIVIFLVLGCLLLGYISLANFLVQEAGEINLVTGFAFLLIALVDEFIGGTLRQDNGVVAALQNNLGIRKQSLEQIGVLSAGILRLVVAVVAVAILLARLKIDSSDIVEQIKAAFFGFKVGDFSFSLSSIAIGSLIFVAGLSITRVIRRWLDHTFLPATSLDAGLRNSILTICGYVGFGITLILSFSFMGLSLDKIAIVAGALSVGIGFGLQSIVNNFVSGLILLWERLIRVGDWVVVGSEGEGYVRNIKVRATEIETFDRATVIVPNSSLISGMVVNKVRHTRIHRIVIPMPLPRHVDADQAAQMIRTCALAHLEVMSQPPANVYFKSISDSNIELQLVCFVEDVDVISRVASELRFAIVRELREAGFLPSKPSTSALLAELTKMGIPLSTITAALQEVAKEADAVPAQPEKTGESESSEKTAEEAARLRLAD